MTPRPVVAVANATGFQGSAVARALLNDPQQAHRVRALVRLPASPQARALADAGAEVVATEMEDSHSVLRALRGSHALFAVTDYWEHGAPERELAQARAMSTAASLADVEHVIWSTQEDSRAWMPLDDARMPTLLQRYKVPSSDAKGEADAFFAASGIPVTLLRTAMAWEQLLAFGMGPRRAEDGALRLALPLGDRSLPGIAVADIGAIVRRLLADGPPSSTRTLGVAAAHLTGRQMALAFQRAVHESVVYDAVSFASWRSLGIPGADALGNLFQFIHDFNTDHVAARSVDTARALYPALQDFDAWLATHRAYIPAI